MLHSDIPGSKFDCNSPRLFAAYHVLLRLSMPRHPSCALSSLTTRKIKISLCLSTKLHFFAVISSRHYFFFICQSTLRSNRSFYVILFQGFHQIGQQYMVGVLGFEPRTSSLSGTRSNQLSYTPEFPKKWLSLRSRTSGVPPGTAIFWGPRSPFVRAAAPYSELRVWYFYL